MKPIEGLSISETHYPLEGGGHGVIAVFMYSGPLDPTPVLNEAVFNYVEDKGFHQLLDANLDNPWMRVVMSEINQIPQRKYDPSSDTISRALAQGKAS